MNKEKKEPSTSTSKNIKKIYSILENGQASIEISNYEKALEYFNKANEEIRANLMQRNKTNEAEIAVTTTGGEEEEEYMILLAKVLSASGDTRVSLGDIENALLDFEEGISLLKKGDDENNNVLDEADNEGMDNAQKVSSSILDRIEVLADLYLYLAQLKT